VIERDQQGYVTGDDLRQNTHDSADLSANKPERISSRIECNAGFRTLSARRCAMPAKPCLKAFWLPGGPDLPCIPPIPVKHSG